MGRPPLPVGTMGEVRYHPAGPDKIRAVANYRDHDGRTRRVERTGRSKAAAAARLKEACRDRGRTDAAVELTGATTVAAAAEQWYAEVEAGVASGRLSPTTAAAYADRLRSQVVPAIGALRLREVTVGRVDKVIRTTTERHGSAVAKMTRTVLSGVLGLAARHDAIESNPVRDAAPIHGTKKPAAALSLDQARQLRARVAADPKAAGWDLVDFADMMLATGLRIGETAAITWPAVDLDAGTVEVRGTVIRVRGAGLVIKPKPKSKSGWRVVELPTWALAMLRRRSATVDDNEWSVVFPTVEGRLRDPSNTQADLRKVFDRAGHPEITSHTFRRTVATLMDRAGLTARAAADQLGHAKVSMTTDNYFGRQVARTGAAGVLEALDQGAERIERGG